MSTYNPRLITPPREEEEIYPYRRVWRSLIIENTLLVILTVGLFVVANIFGVRFPAAWYLPLNLLLALSPAILWVLFSRLPENAARQPRHYLTGVFVMSLLTAGAVGVPLIQDFLQPDKWLSLETAANRILGYTVTTGIVQEFLKYAVLRFTVPGNAYRVRVDAIAASAAAAAGFATVFSLHYAGSNPAALPDVVMLRVLTFAALNLSGSVMVSYGMVETRLSRANIFLLPFTLVAAAFLNGAAIPLRSGLSNAQLTLEGGVTRPILALGFAMALLIVPLAVMSFLYGAAERREQDVLRGQED